MSIRALRTEEGEYDGEVGVKLPGLSVVGMQRGLIDTDAGEAAYL